jgi:hypothetical protein
MTEHTKTEKHTPGPWKVLHYKWTDKGGGDFVGRIDGPNGEKVYGGAASFHAINNLANAHLIAAAPELLAALFSTTEELQRLRDVLLPHYEDKIGEPDKLVLEEAEAAIAKATGGSND